MTTGILSKDEGVGSSAGGTSTLRVAVLDRDSGFIQVLSKRLDRLGWEHRVLASPVPVDAISSMRLSAMVVDLAVLGPQAWTWLERVCGELPDLGIIVCTGPSTVAQRVRGLRLGADDWITKPCHPEEVIARVQGLVRRRRRMAGRSSNKPIVAGEVEIRSDRFQAFVNGNSLGLTRREFELIELLASGEGRVLEREDVYSRLWGYAMVRGDRSVDVFVRKLRHKLERASPDWRYIHTHFGIGYRFAAEPADAETANAETCEVEQGSDAAVGEGGGDSGRAHPVAAIDSAAGGELGLDEGDPGDQRQLGGAQQEYQLATPAA
ncbi:MAG TPA: response regulator transcription factor [Solirubrobacteraceae bacterium]|jgi:DNA-binding response OmpR family regulator|nr:response regulator transcription factor [Solirubrobacteraceae bacterium]